MDLIVQTREKVGKGVKSLRREGLIPAELYGHGVTNVHLAVPAKEFSKVFKQAGENMVINVVLEKEKRPAMIHDVTFNPVTDEIMSIDFYEVRLDELIKVKVPLNFLGAAPAVKEGGILVKAMQEIEVEALPGNIPHTLDVNLNGLSGIGQSIHVKDLGLPAGVKFLVNPETVIVTVKEKAVEEVVAPEVTVESVKVETEEKKAERLTKKEGTESETPSTHPPITARQVPK